MSRVRGLVCSLATLALAASCGTPLTEVLLVVDTDLAVPDELDEVRIDLIGPDASLKRSEGRLMEASELPKTLAIVHRGGPLGPVRVTVTGLRNGRNVVQRRASFFFVEGEVRILRLDLLDACTGLACRSDETCGPNGCRPIDVEEGELRPYDERHAGRFDGGARDAAARSDGGCVAEAEVCNDEDDDCDGESDETFDLETDMQNCGSCGRRCPTTPDNASSRCEAGECALTCDPGFADCDGEVETGCEAALSEAATCGDCDTACDGAAPLCDATADGFACVASCATGTTECSGACVDTTSNPRHCRTCGTVCTPPDNAVATCVASECGFECDAGFADCDGDPADGCESDLRELDNCGVCGVTCSRANGIASCASGTCELVGCDPLFGDCDGVDETGCEADLSADLARCGTCTNACVSDPTNASVACEMGSCTLTCDAGFGSCDGTNATGCETSLAGTESCGGCGIRCEDPTPICESLSGGGYACTDGCSGMLCGESCVDTDADPLHCGACDDACPDAPNASPTCSGGSCGFTCDEGFDDCNTMESDGCEVDLRSSLSDCGTCGMACPAADHAVATCDMGSCGYECETGWADCNGVASDGCEVDTTSDPSHCGECDAACTLGSRATGVDCVDRACVITGCEAPYEDCNGTVSDGCEANTDASTSHCGGCRMACDTGRQTCCTGTCTGPPPHCR
ncbi:MAG TPA: hypothetical protein RMH99_32370 [Sandaracinaceae bacterium LLY-WYZ-13_1]|nr:hypothetical protein [Sandaracinaceae bacterium LLY-WYZ-13_1]